MPAAGHKTAYLIFDSVHSQHEDGSWFSHSREQDGPEVDLTTDEFKRLEDMGAVSGSEKKAAEAVEEADQAAPASPVEPDEK
jgi:hypothetical protein